MLKLHRGETGLPEHIQRFAPSHLVAEFRKIRDKAIDNDRWLTNREQKKKDRFRNLFPEDVPSVEQLTTAEIRGVKIPAAGLTFRPDVPHYRVFICTTDACVKKFTANQLEPFNDSLVMLSALVENSLTGPGLAEWRGVVDASLMACAQEFEKRAEGLCDGIDTTLTIMEFGGKIYDHVQDPESIPYAKNFVDGLTSLVPY